MGLFGNIESRAEFEEIKAEYRAIKGAIVAVLESTKSGIDQMASATSSRWQYLVEEDIGEGRLNELGLLGWDLVNFASYTVGFGIGGNSSMKVHLRFDFKRSIPSLSPELQEQISELNNLALRKAQLVAEIEARGYKAE